MDMQKELEGIWQATYDELTDEDWDIDEWFEDVLSIERTQYKDYYNGWTTKEYVLILGICGPHVELTTNYKINVYWGGSQYEREVPDQIAKHRIDEIEDYLETS